MRPDLFIVAKDGQPVAPALRMFTFGIWPHGPAAMVDGKFVPVDEAFAAMKTHAERCADYTRLQLEELIARRLSDNEIASTPGGIR